MKLIEPRILPFLALALVLFFTGFVAGLSVRDKPTPPRCTHGASSIGPVSIEGGKVTNQPKPHPERLPKGCKP